MLPERPRLGFIGFGTVAYYVAQGLHEEEGFERILAYCNGRLHHPPYTQAFREKAATAGVVLVDTLADLAAGSDLILSAVTAGVTLDVVRQAAPVLTSRHTFVDMNSAPPPVKVEGGKLCAARGVSFVDCVILGGPSWRSAGVLPRHHTPLWVSGPGAQEFQQVMSKYHMPIKVIDGPPGTAAQVKLLRSILMKGLAATLWETVTAARRAGLDRQVQEAAFQWVDTMKFSFFANRLLCSCAIHSGGWAEEMDGVVDMLQELGIEPVMSQAAQRRLAEIAALDLRAYFKAEEPSDYRAMLEAADSVPAPSARHTARKPGAS